MCPVDFRRTLNSTRIPTGIRLLIPRRINCLRDTTGNTGPQGHLRTERPTVSWEGPRSGTIWLPRLTVSDRLLRAAGCTRVAATQAPLGLHFSDHGTEPGDFGSREPGLQALLQPFHGGSLRGTGLILTADLD